MMMYLICCLYHTCMYIYLQAFGFVSILVFPLCFSSVFFTFFFSINKSSASTRIHTDTQRTPTADPSSIFHLPSSIFQVLLLVISHWIRNKCAGGSSFLQSLPPHFLTNPLSLLFPDLVDRLWKQNCRIDQHKEIVQPNRNITPSGHQSSKVQPGTPAFVIIYNCI